MGFDKIKDLLGMLNTLPSSKLISKNIGDLDDTFTKEWVDDKRNIEYLEQLK